MVQEVHFGLTWEAGLLFILKQGFQLLSSSGMQKITHDEWKKHCNPMILTPWHWADEPALSGVSKNITRTNPPKCSKIYCLWRCMMWLICQQSWCKWASVNGTISRSKQVLTGRQCQFLPFHTILTSNSGVHLATTLGKFYPMYWLQE